MAKHTINDLYQMQAMSLNAKIRATENRIRWWIDKFGTDGVYISFSGGKDSTVLMDIVRHRMHLDIPAVFVDVPTQYPQLRDFAMTWTDVEIIKPKTSFIALVKKYGFPLISKEVSETVYYSRRYLRELSEKIQNDEQITKKITGASGMADLLQIKRRKGGSKEFEDLKYGKLDEVYELAKQMGEKIPVRTRILNGELKHKEKGIETEEYSLMYDKSRYKFFLRAKFDLCGNKCCKEMKKSPLKKYARKTGRKPITAQMASESRLRTTAWLNNGCNAYDSEDPISNPMAFWTEQDVLNYILLYQEEMVEKRLMDMDLEFQEGKIVSIFDGTEVDNKEFYNPICSVYRGKGREQFIEYDWDRTDDVEGQLTISDMEGFEDQGIFDSEKPPLKTTGCERTGCVLCGFGAQCRGDKRFLELKESNPKLYGLLDVVENNGVTMREAIEWTNKNGNLNIRL